MSSYSVMKLFISILLLVIQYSVFGQNFSSAEVSSQSFDDYFQNKNKADYSALFVIPNSNSFSITNGEEFEVNLKTGKSLVIFLPGNTNVNGEFRLVNNDGTETILDHSSTFPTSEFKELRFYQDGKVVCNYTF